VPLQERGQIGLTIGIAVEDEHVVVIVIVVVVVAQQGQSFAQCSCGAARLGFLGVAQLEAAEPGAENVAYLFAQISGA
jgi:hypothetical protein